MPLDVIAQQPAPQDGEPATIALGEISVVGYDGRQPNTLNADLGLSRFPGRVQDTPQAISVVPGEVIRQQQATTLEQALRNVPGVTLSSGEGNGGLNGDQFRIRGFQAKNDVYLDGLRDFGVYARDSFNIADVVVIKGPSSESLGLGTAGGAINIVSKRAQPFDFTSVDVLGGSGPTARGTFDVNRKIDETTAIRITGVANRQDIQDRDYIKSDRYGLAASLGFGLGTDTTWHLNYLFQRSERTPDYGVPVVLRPGDRYAKPITEFGLDRSTSYARATDRDNANVHLATSLMKWTVTDWLTVTNDTRLSFYSRNFISTPSSCAGACISGFFGGSNPLIAYTAGGGSAFDQDAWGAQNVTTAIAKFHTGFLRHEVVAGIDAFYQNDDRTNFAVLGTRPTQRLLTPDPRQIGYAYYRNFNSRRVGDGADLAGYFSDRVWLTDQFSLLGGVRVDRFVSSYATTNTTTGLFGSTIMAASTGVSPKGSAIWQPTPDQTYYITYAKGFSPQGQYVANSTGIEIPSTAALKPEETDLYEIGGKVSVLDGRLGLAAALFRVDKSNSFDIDPVTGGLILGALDAGERRRVDGFELTATGRITPDWSILAGYTHLEGKVLSGANVGKVAPYVPENAFTMWTTYDMSAYTRQWWDLPGKITIGGGVSFDDGYFPASDNITRIPGTFSLDTLISYETENYRVAVNAYNLTDELNYAGAFSTRAIPTSGRTVLVSLGTRF
ncbi:catecholate siderophore receptor [Methylobacterium brachiatum]|uniref:Catecholate siderophore receptor n=1 Tax=Methylobacterium brachiatum TaxID=269660 RepID=A0AAJ1U2I3_9HYPH|nr:TonB-dependent receptor [Methylobacterium brachiatum]MCB4805567.1 TonB-dependent receptor [Methylobacterium brachiatum]MDQ0546783.1 catecholate siderophore receptor [Methylobacterium brachiatum]